MEKKIDNKSGDKQAVFFGIVTSVENMSEPGMYVEVSVLLVQPPWPPSMWVYCSALLA